MIAARLALLVAVSVLAPPDAEDQRLSAYLERLGLVDLRTRLLETRWSAIGPDSDGKKAAAIELADLYSRQLLENLDRKDRYDDLSRRVAKLLNDYPAARTASLDILLLQADFQRAEKLAGQWMGDAGETASRDEARAILERITPVLESRSDQLRVDVERRIAESEKRGGADGAADAALMGDRAMAARAAYFAGWSRYYRALMITGMNDDARKARADFRSLLEITDDEKVAALDPDLLGLESPWRARALIGLGLCEAGLGDLTESQACFQCLAKGGAPADLRGQADYWYVLGLINAGKREEAARFAATRIAALPSEPTQERVSLCALLVRSAYGDPAHRESDASRSIGQSGIRGLARLRQHGILRELLNKYQVAFDNPEGFTLRWLRGRQLRETADRSKKADDYQAALEMLRAALVDPESAGDIVGAGHCRAELAWCLFQSGRIAEAAAEYARAAETLRTAGDSGAVESGWMAFAAAHRRWKDEGGSDQAVHAALDWLKREFPGHEHTRKAEFLAMRMSMGSAPPRQQIDALEKIPPSDPSYLAARQERCRLLCEEWKHAPDAERDAAAESAVRAIDELFAAAGSRLDPTDVLRLRLMALDMAVQRGDWPTARRHLDANVETAAAPRDLLSEWHYRGIQAGRGGNQPDRADPHVAWMLEQGSGTRFEIAGLVAAAKMADAAVEREGPSGSEAASRALAIYERLARSLGDTPEALQANRNALAASTKYLALTRRLGRRADARLVADRLLAAFPKDRAFLRAAAQLAFEDADHAESLTHWRTILAGTRVGVAEWYEAKYHQIRCLMVVDPPAARTVFDQLRELDPDLGPPDWREKFVALERSLR
ncbi:MAG: hypothetical protein FJ297_09620 [Planctomycetes bacterium]|nr:hypothetical protein [Planctomycetota bacterium]